MRFPNSWQSLVRRISGWTQRNKLGHPNPSRGLAGENLEERRLLVSTIAVSIDLPDEVPEQVSSRLNYTLSRDETEDFLSVRFQLSGSATYGVDYTARERDSGTVQFPADPDVTQPIIATATFFPGEDEVDVIVTPIVDSVDELDEQVVLSILGVDEFGLVNGAAALIVHQEETRYFVVDNQNQLGEVDTTLGYIDVIGTVATTEPLTDIAFLDDGTMMGISENILYEIDFENVLDEVVPFTSLGNHMIIGANSLVDARDGDFGSGSGDLFAIGQAFLGIQLIDIEIAGDSRFINNVTTVFDVNAALAARSFASDYAATGDIDYLASGNLSIAAQRPLDEFDSLIEVEVTNTGGFIENGPDPAEDPGETFDDLFGLAYDGSESYAFANYTLLKVNQFSQNSSRELELTGRSYLIDDVDSATGIIEGVTVSPPTLQINSLQSDSAELPWGPLPTTWVAQRSLIADLVLDLGWPITEVPDGSVILTNLGTTAFSVPLEIILRPDQFTISPNGRRLAIQLDSDQLPDGRYQIDLAASITNGPPLTIIGDRDNDFFQLRADFDGSGNVDLRDLYTLAYWYGQSTITAPSYADLDLGGTVNQLDLGRFEAQFTRSISLPGIPPDLDPTWLDTDLLLIGMRAAADPLDVNGTAFVSPLDALNVLNRLATGLSTGVLDWRFDVNRDGSITPRDALRIINALAVGGSRSAGEGEFTLLDQVHSHYRDDGDAWFMEDQIGLF